MLGELVEKRESAAEPWVSMQARMQLRTGIKLLSETEGTGEPVKKGDKVRVRLSGWLNRGEPIQENHVEEIVVGRRQVIPGLEYSLEGMKKGGVRKVKISPHLGYRDRGVSGRIPSHAVLIYEIEILDIREGT
jgi:FKBP-type peptidyl-prolyl cis-trans isomerase